MGKRTLLVRAGRALARPRMIVPYVSRSVRNRRLRRQAESHTAFYRLAVDADARKDPQRAVGSHSREHWLEVGKLQFDYLLRHGLRADYRVLDIGCGNLRLGWRLIDHLHIGGYYGIDASPEILLAALRTVEEFRLQEKEPRIVLVGDLRFGFLPEGYFDVVQAHSVFSHTPLDVLDECLAHVGRVMKPSAFFDLTWFSTDGTPYSKLGEDFYFPRHDLSDLAAKHGFSFEVMSDWVYVQDKARLRRPLAAEGSTA